VHSSGSRKAATVFLPYLRVFTTAEASQILEFAVALPLLAVFIVGTFDFSQAFNLKQKLNNAAREGARFASNLPTNDLSNATSCGSPPSPASVCAVRDLVSAYLQKARINGLRTEHEGGFGYHTVDLCGFGKWLSCGWGFNLDRRPQLRLYRNCPRSQWTAIRGQQSGHSQLSLPVALRQCDPISCSGRELCRYNADFDGRRGSQHGLRVGGKLTTMITRSRHPICALRAKEAPISNKALNVAISTFTPAAGPPQMQSWTPPSPATLSVKRYFKDCSA